MPEYKYVKINDRYYCLQQNPVILAWIVFLKKSTLDIVYRPYPRKIAHKIPFLLQRKWRAFRHNFFVYLALIRYKYIQNISKSALTLPLYGQMCKAAHQGYKIFDFRRNVVIKVFGPNIDKKSVIKEIDILKIVSQMDFAPSLRKWDIEKQWYEEDYIEGYLDVDHSYKPADDSITVRDKFCHFITPCIEKLIFLQAPMTVNIKKYLNDITDVVENSSIFQQDFVKINNKEIPEINKFFRATIEQLRAERNCPVYLVFTHGDFCSANIINTKDTIKILDWEHAAYRSALFDFYSYFFYRPYRNKISVHDLVLEINEAFPFFISKLSLKSREISESISSLGSIYRLLYYIERINMLLERAMTDTNLDVMGKISIYIDVYRKYEEFLAQGYPEAYTEGFPLLINDNEKNKIHAKLVE
ncbi:MAG: phosphotransferase [Thermodesulfovibrionales bacterium]|nr:phosphotransferase [Thermodesulfovibrionales bacterium]